MKQQTESAGPEIVVVAGRPGQFDSEFLTAHPTQNQQGVISIRVGDPKHLEFWLEVSLRLQSKELELRAALERLLQAPDLNLDCLEPETQSAIHPAREIVAQ